MTITNSLPSDVMKFIYLYPFHKTAEGFNFYTRSTKDNLHDLIKRNK